MQVTDAPASARKRRNWWKIGFFVALFAFEMAREVAVISANAETQVAAFPSVSIMDNFAMASGSWVRTDGGEKLVRNAVSIRCDGQLGICIEAQANWNKGYLYEPHVDYFKAEFSPNAVTYRNDEPTCVTYEVRLDARLDRGLATRKKKPEAANKPECKQLEDSMQMQLADGFVAQTTDGHFVPLLQGLALLFRLFD